MEINPEDAEKLGIRPNEWIFVESRRARIKVKAFVTPIVKPGQVFSRIHYEDANRLTFSAFDPYSRQPAYKACAVNVRRPEYWEEQ